MKAWQIFRHEYVSRVMRKRFLISLLSIPAMFFFAVIALGIMLAILFDFRPIGYIDLTGSFAEPQEVYRSEERPFVDLEKYQDETAARQALFAGRIQAYFIIQRDYWDTGRVQMVALKRPGENAESSFKTFLRRNLIKHHPAPVIRRLSKGTSTEVRLLIGPRQPGPLDWIQAAIPLASGGMLILVFNMSGGYLTQALVEEKENRTIEILVTSTSTSQLMIGKIAGALSVGLTQIFIWLLFPALFLVSTLTLMANYLNLTFNPLMLWLIPVTLLPAFVIMAALMATLGAVLVESRYTGGMIMLFTLPMIACFFLLRPVTVHPDGMLAVGLSLFPLTAPIMLPLRSVFTEIPLWQLLLSLGLLYGSAAGSLWLAGRSLRLGLLRYGKPLFWRERFQREG